jgi:glycosyl transferase family WbsX
VLTPELARTPRARLIAFYLPQFHPIPENDEWWGPGFTEWTNVAKARPLFRGHYQPRIPADLGFYDLRLPETRIAQADLAHKAGIEGFCYWHYWFAGKRLLERPFEEVVKSGEPDFPFCLGWANQSWSGIWHGAPNRILMQQTYPGPSDHERHFHALLPAFHDPRYIRVRGMPVFVIFEPKNLPNLRAFIDQWRLLADRNGLKGIHFVSHLFHHEWAEDYESVGFSGAVVATNVKMLAVPIRTVAARHVARLKRRTHDGSRMADMLRATGRVASYTWTKARRRLFGSAVDLFHYEDASMFFVNELQRKPNAYPCVIPDWDNSPRSGARGFILYGSTPTLFRRHLEEAVQLVEERDAEDRIVFVKSWNEWAEGNYLEPDRKFGHQYLDAVRETVFSGKGMDRQ